MKNKVIEVQNVHISISKQKLDDYWAIGANTCVTGTEKDLYEQVNTLVQQYWDAEAQAMEIGASTDKEDSIKA